MYTFFGGFILAIAATRHGFDVQLARIFLIPFGTRPRAVLLGVVLATGIFSMFMSNTATTAMMIAILAPILNQLADRPNLRRTLVLAVPFAASIGGMGTVIGSPPNAVAVSVLERIGVHISFLEWMRVCAPLSLVLLILLWLLLITTLPPKPGRLEVKFPPRGPVTFGLVMVASTFTVTVLMWLTEPLHRIPSAVVAMLPVAAFGLFGIIDRDDLRRIDWDVLILVAGGMTLGVAMHRTGLTDLLVAAVPIDRVPPLVALLTLSAATILLSNFMSNTAAANILVPIATSLFASRSAEAGTLIALAASLAMSLPISTPPNAIAFATRTVSTGEMARYGSIMSVIGLIVLSLGLALLLSLETRLLS